MTELGSDWEPLIPTLSPSQSVMSTDELSMLLINVSNLVRTESTKTHLSASWVLLLLKLTMPMVAGSSPALVAAFLVEDEVVSSLVAMEGDMVKTLDSTLSRATLPHICS